MNLKLQLHFWNLCFHFIFCRLHVNNGLQKTGLGVTKFHDNRLNTLFLFGVEH